MVLAPCSCCTSLWVGARWGGGVWVSVPPRGGRRVCRWAGVVPTPPSAATNEPRPPSRLQRSACLRGTTESLLFPCNPTRQEFCDPPARHDTDQTVQEAFAPDFCWALTNVGCAARPRSYRPPPGASAPWCAVLWCSDNKCPLIRRLPATRSKINLPENCFFCKAGVAGPCQCRCTVMAGQSCIGDARKRSPFFVLHALALWLHSENSVG